LGGTLFTGKKKVRCRGGGKNFFSGLGDPKKGAHGEILKLLTQGKGGKKKSPLLLISKKIRALSFFIGKKKTKKNFLKSKVWRIWGKKGINKGKKPPKKKKKNPRGGLKKKLKRGGEKKKKKLKQV